MPSNKRIITRRDFIRNGSYVTIGGMIGLPLLANASAVATTKSRVILIRDSKMAGGPGPMPAGRLAEMLDEAVTALFNASEASSAWQQIVKPDDIVGIKSNAWGHLPTPPALEDAVVKRLLAAGVKENHVSVDDRGVRRNPVFKNSTALINMRPMRTHHWAGLGTLLKNCIMFTSTPWAYHGNACERLGAIWQKYNIGTKTRLNILVMLTPLFHGIGPHHYSKQFQWPYAGLIVSTDPVAADATGARIIQAKRMDYFGDDRPISPRPLHIEAADTQFGLGNSRPDKIELIKLGWDKDILI